MKKTCNNCGAFNALGSECRRHSPTMVPIQSQNGLVAYGLYPATVAQNWCAEWLPEEAKVIAP